MPRPSLVPFTLLLLRIGNLTFGGGDPTMAALQRELVERRRWLTAEQYALAFSLARVTPGTNVLAFCAGAGWLIRGWIGAAIAVLATSAPSAVLAVWLSSAYTSTANVAWVQRVFSAVAACATGMTVAGAILLVRPQLARGWLRPLTITAAAFLATQAGLSPIPVLAAAAIAGMWWGDK